jgi:predicted AAA+ superfamily ATPase
VNDHRVFGIRCQKSQDMHCIMGDTGLAASLLGVDTAALRQDRSLLGQLLESFVFQELRRQASWSENMIRFHHLRDKDGYEVDIVLEREGREIAGVEVKASATVKNSDFRALRRLQAALGKRFLAGIVLYDGESAVRFANNLFAVPLTSLLGGE